MRKWESLESRIVKEARDTLVNNRSNGVAIITTHIVIDSSGQPLFWVVRDGLRVEPSRDAKKMIIKLLGGIHE